MLCLCDSFFLPPHFWERLIRIQKGRRRAEIKTKIMKMKSIFITYVPHIFIHLFFYQISQAIPLLLLLFQKWLRPLSKSEFWPFKRLLCPHLWLGAFDHVCLLWFVSQGWMSVWSTMAAAPMYAWTDQSASSASAPLATSSWTKRLVAVNKDTLDRQTDREIKK